MLKNKNNYKNIAVGIIGNICEHYDNALFAFLAPFIAPLFFPNKSIILSLIFMYTMVGLGILFRPLGALLFGYIADKYGRSKALFLALLGSSISCSCIALLPVYSKISFFAPLLLALFKATQSFFAAGETPTGAFFILENVKEKSFASSLYDASSIMGILLASFLVTIFSGLNIIHTHWRYLFLIGTFTAIIGIFIRKTTIQISNTNACSTLSNKFTNFFKLFHTHFLSFINICFVYGFSYALYSFCFVFLNGFLPLISSLSNTQTIKINTYLLLLDLCLLPLFGMLAQKFSKEKMMLLALFVFGISIFPLLFFLNTGSFMLVVVIRSIFVIIGVCFSASIHHLIQELAYPHGRLQVVSVAYAFGSQLIGMPFCAISFWLYKKTSLIYIPGIYLLIFASLAFSCIYLLVKKKKNAEEKVLTKN